MAKVKGLRDRLSDGESVICAEGYMWELERRGFVQCGEFTPEVVMDFPDMVTSIHKEFVLAGSDIVEAYTYYGNRENLKNIGRGEDVEKINMESLRLARQVADEYGKLMAGNVSNTKDYDPGNEASHRRVAAMFKEQVQWAVAGGADMMIGETFNDLGEAKLALEAIQKYGNGIPAVITLAAYCPEMTTDDVPIPEALRELEKMGADVVGLNCGRGPATMLPLLRKCRAVCKGPLAALPVAYRTTEKEKTFQAITDYVSGDRLYPLNVACKLCTREEIRAFAKEAREIGIRYVGLCCGSCSNLIREVAEEYGKRPPASRNAPKLSSTMVNAPNLTAHRKKWRDFMTGTSD